MTYHAGFYICALYLLVPVNQALEHLDSKPTVAGTLSLMSEEDKAGHSSSRKATCHPLQRTRYSFRPARGAHAVLPVT